MLVRNLRSVPLRSGVRSFGSTTVCCESYTEKQAKLGRPVSPHVTIYKFPVTALSSITNRVTGVTLSVGKQLIFIESLSVKIFYFLTSCFISLKVSHLSLPFL